VVVSSSYGHVNSMKVCLMNLGEMLILEELIEKAKFRFMIFLKDFYLESKS
jgi:hypothetical protein